MGITVRHDPSGAALAAGAALSGLGKQLNRDADRAQQDAHLSQRLRQQRELQMASIDAQADLQKQSADEAMARTALRYGLEGQLREEEFDRNLDRMQEESRLKAEQWEYQYTAKQRQEIAKFNNARQMVEDSDNWSPEEKQAALRAIDLKQANVKPSMMPRDPSKPTYPEGRSIGEAWVNSDGSTVARTKDGDVKLIQRYDQSPDFHKQKFQAERERKALELQAKREEKLLELRMKIATEAVDQLDADGNATGSRFRTPEEVNTIMQAIMGEQPQQPQQAQQPQQPIQWWEKAEKAGMKVAEADRQLPPQVGMAQAYFRHLLDRYGTPEKVPPKMQPAFREAAGILRQFTAME